MKQYLDEMEIAISEEILLYKDLESLYKEKENVLIHEKADQLVEIDSKILDRIENLKPIIKKRNDSFYQKFGTDMTITKLVEESSKIDDAQSKRFANMQFEVNTLIKELKQQDHINQELTKFGIRLTNKTMQIILNNVSIPSNEYNNRGKTLSQEKLQISSISEEA